jgi:predicted RNA-binding Zn ribbon-like protein
MHAHSDSLSLVNQPDDAPFLFLADVLALDLINTAIRVRGRPRDLLATPADVLHWWEAARRRYPDSAVVQRAHDLLVDHDLYDAVVGLRAALHTMFSALVEQVTPAPQAIAQVNTILQTGHQAIEWTSAGALQPVYQTSGYGNALLFPIALSAVTWLATGDRQRLHRCANERCVLLFYDTTKSATRRWCSIGCMDRARSSQRYQQAKRTHVRQ